MANHDQPSGIQIQIPPPGRPLSASCLWRHLWDPSLTLFPARRMPKCNERREERKRRVPQEPPVPEATRVPVSQRIPSIALLNGTRELVIEHAGEEYRLRLTSKGKLILTK